MQDDVYRKVSTVSCGFELIIELVRMAAEKQEVTEGCRFIQLALVY